MPPLLYDPPELHEDAARVDPPISPMARRHTAATGCVIAAGGDPRDRFRYGRRYEAYLRCWHERAGAPASRSYQGLLLLL